MDAKRIIKGTEAFNEAIVEINQWAEARNFPFPDVSLLPETLIMIYNNSRPSCCGFLYRTDSGICWLAWVISNPDTTKEERAESLSVLFSCSKVACQTMGFSTLFTMSGNESLSKKLEPHFVLGDTNAANYFWRG